MICFQLAKREGEDRPAYLQRTADFLNYIADQAYDISLAVSLGLLKTVIECPALMTHSSYSEDALIRAGILPGAIRLSVGTEAPADIIADLGEALEKAA